MFLKNKSNSNRLALFPLVEDAVAWSVLIPLIKYFSHFEIDVHLVFPAQLENLTSQFNSYQSITIIFFLKSHRKIAWKLTIMVSISNNIIYNIIIISRDSHIMPSSRLEPFWRFFYYSVMIFTIFLFSYWVFFRWEL